MPLMLSPITSHSPVCNPARISIPSRPTASVAADAQRIARAGPSNVANPPSPAGGDLPSAKSRKLSAHRRIVPIEKLAPATVSKPGRALRRPDNIHEENRGEHTVRFRGLSHARQEFLDLGDQTVGVLGKEQMVPSRQLDISRTLYVLGQISAVLRPGEGVARP